MKRTARGLFHPVVLLALSLLGPGAAAAAGDAAGCESRSMRVTFYTCGEGLSHCLTKQGHQPIPFRTVAVGDRRLLGRWLYIEDLGGWVLAADTGSALKKNSIDVFIGVGRMARHAMRLGVQYWDVRVCAPAPGAPAPPERQVARPVSVPATAASPQVASLRDTTAGQTAFAVTPVARER